MPTLTQGQQRALNTLTTTALSVEMAELDAQNTLTDDLSRSLRTASRACAAAWPR